MTKAIGPVETVVAIGALLVVLGTSYFSMAVAAAEVIAFGVALMAFGVAAFVGTRRRPRR